MPTSAFHQSEISPVTWLLVVVLLHDVHQLLGWAVLVSEDLETLFEGDSSLVPLVLLVEELMDTFLEHGEELRIVSAHQQPQIDIILVDRRSDKLLGLDLANE